MAKRRPFRYAVLLRVRRLQEDLKAFELAAIRRDIQKATQEREFIANEQARMLEEASHVTQRESFDGSRIGRYYQYERHLSRRSVEKDAFIAQKRHEEEMRREELEHATKRRRIVERIEERHDTAQRAEFDRFEQRTSDEVAVSQAANERIKRRQSS